MNETSLRQTFLPNVGTGSERDEALKAFARENKELALKTKPKASGPPSIYHYYRDPQLIIETLSY
jgi:hypothetical protein